MSRDEPPSLLRPRLVAIVLSVIGVFVLLVAVASVQGTPQFRPVQAPGWGGPVVETSRPDETIQPTMAPEDYEAGPVAQVIAIIVASLIGLLVLFVIVRSLVALVRYLRERWENRQPVVRDGADLALQPAAQGEEGIVDAPTIRRGLAGALLTVEEVPVASDAIVAAWVGVEETAHSAGQQRGRSETAGEFTVRILGDRESIAHDTQQLLSLYETVRFGGGQATETDRQAARDMLARIERGWR